MSTIAKLILQEGQVARNDLITMSGLSSPTVLQKVKNLMKEGLVEEVGASEPTGGRKAKLLAMVSHSKYAVGVNVTKHHLELVLSGLDGQILEMERIRLVFEPTRKYYTEFSVVIETFINKYVRQPEKLLGVAVSLPGVMDMSQATCIRSRVLGVDHYSTSDFSKAIKYQVVFDNDANFAAYSEKLFRNSTAFYLSLNNTIGGAFSVDGQLYGGTNNKSSEIGHITLVPDGKKCYCGKMGCVDCYCSALQLEDGNLPVFFSKIENGDIEAISHWKRYLKYLAIVIADLRVMYDCEIIVGGYVGGFLEPYLSELEELIAENLLLDIDTSFLHCGQYKWEASAYGAALKVIDHYVMSLD